MRISTIIAILLIAGSASAQQLAFPKAEGFGRYTTGGRGGSVYHVTNLNDSGAGSFRDAVSQPNRYVVFDIGGVIKISSVVVVEDNITIAGMTAPGGGITIYGNRVAFNGNSGNDVVRYMRFRMGRYNGASGVDALSISDNKDNYMFDHVSVSWGRDGTFDINTDSENITLQDCIIGQGLQRDNHSTGALIQGANLSISIIRTLWIDNKTRNPKIRGTHEFINSVLYNWGTDGFIAGDTEGLSQCNMMGNYFIYGPSSTGSYMTRTTPTFNIYPSDNWVDSNKDGKLNGTQITSYSTATVVSTPFNYPGVNNVLSADAAVYHVLNNAGSSLHRDAIDELLIEELGSFGTKGAIIYGEEDNNIPNYVGVVESGTKLPDTDNDGMPDYFEDLIGYDKTKADHNLDADSDGFPNIEEYFNCLTCDCDVPMPNCPTVQSGNYQIKVKSTGLCFQNDEGSVLQNECGETSDFGWTLTEENGDGFIIESMKDGKYLTFSEPAEAAQIRTTSVRAVAKKFAVTLTENLEYKISPVDATNMFLSANSDKSIVLSANAQSNQLLLLTGFVPLRDCNGTIDGSAIIDDCGSCVGGTTGNLACPGGIGGEEFCETGSIGVFEDTNSGYLGTGYFNFDNAVGTTAKYTIYSKISGSTEVTFRYANGGTASRPVSVTLNNAVVIPSLDFPVTSSWTDWQEVKASINFTKGDNELILTATTADGGPNLDLIFFGEEGYYGIDCDGGQYTLDCFSVPDGTAFLDDCGKCVGGNTGKEACVEILSNNLETAVRFFPNPFTSEFSIESKESFGYALYDLSGKTLVKNNDLKSGVYLIGNDLEQGIYLLKINLKNGQTFTNRIIKNAY